MKSKILKYLKKMLIGTIIIILVLTTVTIGFIKLSPQFGGKATFEQREHYQKSNNYKNEKFINQKEVQLDMGLRDMGRSLVGYFKPQVNSTPLANVQVQRIDSLEIVQHKDSARVVWFGHSAFLLQISNKTILIDPMFGDVPAPHPMLGGKRFSKELPIAVEKLPNIDAVLISHDHYDHLDYETIQKLKDRVERFYTPLGVGAHLVAWGVEPSRIVELDWWEEAQFNDLKFACTPAQHFSGRGLTDRAKTLWSSWVIQSETESIFFSGDSGYASHFKEIGEKYGPFDFAMMECGQYNEMWSDIHMFPEETLQAGIDVRAKTIMPIHWGAFKLAMHSWTDPIERITKAAEKFDVKIVIPQIGETLDINALEYTTKTWWKNYN